MVFDWPQITYLSMVGITLLCYAILDGEPRTGTHKFGLQVLGAAFVLWLLWEGGFFGPRAP